MTSLTDYQRQCMRCSDPTSSLLYRLCDPCFEAGKLREPPRQSGRTTLMLKELSDDRMKVLAVIHAPLKRFLEQSYPWLKHQIITVNEYHKLRGMTGDQVLIDHTVMEQGAPDEFRYALALISRPKVSG